MYTLNDATTQMHRIFGTNLFENSLSRSVHPYTLLDASFCCAKTSPLRETTDILSVLNTIYRQPFEIDGVDARSLAEIKRRRTFCTSSIYFGVATTQMRRIFQKDSLAGRG